MVKYDDMHHTLRFYGQHQHKILRLYMSLAKLTNIPLIGRLVRWVANTYGLHEHHGYFLTLGEAEQIIDASRNVALGPCSCRQVFHNCDAPIMAEIVVGTGAEVFPEIRSGEFHAISKEEAKDVMRQCHQKRLIPTLERCQGHSYAICNCCTCCCVPLRLKKNYGIGNALVRNKEVVKDFQREQL